VMHSKFFDLRQKVFSIEHYDAPLFGIKSSAFSSLAVESLLKTRGASAPMRRDCLD
jgi:hypothetical protein